MGDAAVKKPDLHQYWQVSVMRELPKPIADVYVERIEKTYRNFVPERRVDLYLKEELKIRDHTDITRLLQAAFLTREEHNAIEAACGDSWENDHLVGLLLGGTTDINYGSSIIDLVARDWRRARTSINVALGDGGLEPLPKAETWSFPISWGGRWVSMRTYRQCGSYEEAKGLEKQVAAAVGERDVAVTFEKPEKWHVTINTLMADIGGLRQYARREGALKGGHCFDHAQVSAERYNTVRATITRACARLAARGLIVRSDRYGREIYESAAIAITTDGAEHLEPAV
jgi:hypothetical protein